MYKLNHEKVFYDTSDGESIVINFMTGFYYCFNAPGAAIFEYLVNGGAPEALPGDRQDQVLSFVKHLEDEEILVKDSAPYKEVPFDSSALAGAEAPSVTQYDEVQDLILADPIKEVK